MIAPTLLTMSLFYSTVCDVGLRTPYIAKDGAAASRKACASSHINSPGSLCVCPERELKGMAALIFRSGSYPWAYVACVRTGSCALCKQLRKSHPMTGFAERAPVHESLSYARSRSVYKLHHELLILQGLLKAIQLISERESLYLENTEEHTALISLFDALERLLEQTIEQSEHLQEEVNL